MIYICFGMMKSASTFLYQLVEETFRVAGRRPVRLGPPLRFHWSVENYIDGDLRPTPPRGNLTLGGATRCCPKDAPGAPS